MFLSIYLLPESLENRYEFHFKGKQTKTKPNQPTLKLKLNGIAIAVLVSLGDK